MLDPKMVGVELVRCPMARVRGHKWPEYKVTISKLQEDSGYDFISALPDPLEKKVETLSLATPKRNFHCVLTHQY
jgi:hypothetical protein